MSALRILAVVALSFHAATAWVAEAKAPSQNTTFVFGDMRVKGVV